MLFISPMKKALFTLFAFVLSFSVLLLRPLSAYAIASSTNLNKAISPSHKPIGSQGLSACLRQSVDLSNPGTRDRQRLKCFEIFASQMTLSSCLHRTKAFEYSMNSEDAKRVCLTKNSQKLNVQNCLMTANSLEYGDEKDDLLWGCIRELAPKLSQTACLKLAQKMVFTPLKNRSTSYCMSEL